jgi:hypothetical protein
MKSKLILGASIIFFGCAERAHQAPVYGGSSVLASDGPVVSSGHVAGGGNVTPSGSALDHLGAPSNTGDLNHSVASSLVTTLSGVGSGSFLDLSSIEVHGDDTSLGPLVHTPPSAAVGGNRGGEAGSILGSTVDAGHPVFSEGFLALGEYYEFQGPHGVLYLSGEAPVVMTQSGAVGYCARIGARLPTVEDYRAVSETAGIPESSSQTPWGENDHLYWSASMSKNHSSFFAFVANLEEGNSFYRFFNVNKMRTLLFRCVW